MVCGVWQGRVEGREGGQAHAGLAPQPAVEGASTGASHIIPTYVYLDLPISM